MKLKIFTDHKHQWRQITPNSKSNGKDNLQWKSNLCFSIKAISSFFHFKSKCWNISILVFPKSHINIHHCHIFLYIGCGPRQMEDLRHSVEGVSKYRILSQQAEQSIYNRKVLSVCNVFVYSCPAQVGFHGFSWFQVSFSWFQVSFHDFSWF